MENQDWDALFPKMEELHEQLGHLWAAALEGMIPPDVAKRMLHMLGLVQVVFARAVSEAKNILVASISTEARTQ